MLHELNYQVLNELGLELDQELRVIDGDNGSIISIQGKLLKADFGNVRAPFIGRNDMLFDPSGNYKIISNLFTYYIEKLHQTEGRYFNIFYPVQLKNGKIYIEAKENMVPIRSNSYMNPCIAFIDLIFRINGEGYDLSIYDSDPNQK